MSNPDSSTPSIQALDKAVKPAGYYWAKFERDYEPDEGPYKIALAYAEFLDKADKVGRFHVSGGHECREGIDALAQALILPDPIDPDLLEAREMAANAAPDMVTPHPPGRLEALEKHFLAALKRGRELAKEQDRG